MLMYNNVVLQMLVLIVSFQNVLGNLSCYQCQRNSTEAFCDEKDLKPCQASSDRCVTHIANNGKDGLIVRRECGQAPCSFDDANVEKGLGIQCDRSRKNFFCIFCCKEDGCNINSLASNKFIHFSHYFTVLNALTGLTSIFIFLA